MFSRVEEGSIILFSLANPDVGIDSIQHYWFDYKCDTSPMVEIFSSQAEQYIDQLILLLHQK